MALSAHLVLPLAARLFVLLPLTVPFLVLVTAKRPVVRPPAATAASLGCTILSVSLIHVDMKGEAVHDVACSARRGAEICQWCVGIQKLIGQSFRSHRRRRSDAGVGQS